MRILRSVFRAVALMVCLSGMAGESALAATRSLEPAAVASGVGSARLPFVANQGQLGPDVRFYASTFAGTAFVTDRGLTYAVPAGHARETEARPMVAIRETFLPGDARRAKGVDPSPALAHSFVGDRARWRSRIPTYQAVAFDGVWPHVDLELRARGLNIEKIVHVGPGGRVEDVRLAVEGARRLAVNDRGELVLDTDRGALTFSAPVAFQDIGGHRRAVDVAYAVSGHTYGFRVGSYDRSRKLVIDPLIASTLVGGSDRDISGRLALDSAGNVIVAAYSESTDYPTTAGAYQPAAAAFGDVVITKLDPSLTSVLASTFIGGARSFDIAHGIAVDGFDNVYVAGSTSSNDYPVTPGAHRTTFANSFISKLSGDLGSLLASTFVTGATTGVADLALDGAGNVFGVGGSGSQMTVWKLNAGLTSLLASESITRSASSSPQAIAVDAFGNVFVAGGTLAGDFPTTAGAYDSVFDGPVGDGSGGGDAFVAKLDNGLTSLVASTFLGGSNGVMRFVVSEVVTDVGFDASGNVLVAGRTPSSDFPVSADALDPSHNGDFDGFVAKMSPDLTSLLAATFLGGAGPDWVAELAVGGSGAVFVAGPTANGVAGTFVPGWAFVSVLDADLTSLVAPTFIPSAGGEASALALDAHGNVYVLGDTQSAAFPTTPGAFDRTFNGVFGEDLFVMHLDLLAPTITCPPDVVHAAADGPLTSGDIGLATAADNTGEVTVANNAPPTFPAGLRTVTWTATDPSGNRVSCQQSVNVIDEEPPTVSCPASLTAPNAPNEASARVSYPPATATDNTPGVRLACSPASGSTFLLGDTTVTCTATDTSGNTATCTFTVTVNDIEPPVVACPADRTAPNDPGQASAVVSYPAATVTDNAPAPTVACSPASGSGFPLGGTTVTCTATDTSANASTCTFRVTVNDVEPPRVTAPADRTAEATSPDGAVVNDEALGTATATDNAPGVTLTRSGVPPGNLFPLGTTTLTYTATDVAGNSASALQRVAVLDTTAPVIAINAPAATAYTLNQAVAADYACTDTASAVTSCAGPVAAGAAFDTSSPGTKTFTVRAMDAAGNAGSRSVTYGVGYGICVLHDRGRAVKSGSTIPLKVQLCDAAGANHSTPAVVVTAVGLVQLSDNATGEVEDSGQANPGDNFRFDAALGGSGGYIFNLSTRGLATGTYAVALSVSGDPTSHGGEVVFQVR